jgi:ABC-2 type transport system ATP-binding protein
MILLTASVPVLEGSLVSVASPVSLAQPIAVELLIKRFGAVTALDGVSLTVRSGECLGLLGPNGAGKSTLIRGIVGRVIPDSGRISVFGHAAGSGEAREALGWVPQELAIYPRLTCRENLASFGRYHGLAGSKLAEAVAWCLEWAALEDRSKEIAKNLSGGMKRRLNMAAGIIHRPPMVLMDEPTVGVDPQSRNRIFEMIEALRAQGTTVIYTTHYMEEAERLCDRIAIIDHGRIIAQGTNAELVHNAFGARSRVLVRFAGSGPEIAAWVERRGGHMAEGVAQFTVERSTEIASLLDDTAQAGLEVEDISLRRPNLESVFLHLTGRELRD